MNKLQKILTISTLGLASILAGCEKEQNKEVTKNPTPVYEPREPQYTEAIAQYTEAMDGSKVLVIQQPNGSFVFYKDRDNDGFVDSKGKGFYLMGLSTILKEEELPQKIKIYMEDSKSRKIMHKGTYKDFKDF